MQNQISSEQDAGLDALSSIISRQKQMGQEIGNELDEQNGKNMSEIYQIYHLVWILKAYLYWLNFNDNLLYDSI